VKLRTALIVSAVIITGMFVLQYATQHQIKGWVDQEIELSQAQKIRMAVAFVWARFWWFGVLAITGFFVVVSKLTSDD
jgi:hypothetical protein